MTLRPGPRVHLALIAVQVMFASLATVMKTALVELPRFPLIVARVTLATAILCMVAAARGWERVAWRDLPALALYAFFGITANMLIFVAGLERSTATNAVVIGASIPVFTVGVAVALRRERATPAKLIGLLVALCGAIGIVGAAHFDPGGSRLIGNLLIVLNSLSFSIYLVISRPLLARYSTLTVITWTFIFGWIGVLPFGLRGLIAAAPALHSETWFAVAYIALFPTVGTYFLNSYALKRAPSSLVAIYIYAQPVMGAILAARWLHERITLATVGGGLLIGAGIWLVTRADRAERA